MSSQRSIYVHVCMYEDLHVPDPVPYPPPPHPPLKFLANTRMHIRLAGVVVQCVWMYLEKVWYSLTTTNLC